MAMKIRLARGGSKKRPHYAIVATDSRMPRDGRFIEKLGTYNPLLPKDSEERVKMDIIRWLPPFQSTDFQQWQTFPASSTSSNKLVTLCSKSDNTIHPRSAESAIVVFVRQRFNRPSARPRITIRNNGKQRKSDE